MRPGPLAGGPDLQCPSPGDEDDGSYADWQFLLPLPLGRVLFLSTCAKPDRLARTVERLVVAQPDPLHRPRLGLAALLARVLEGSAHCRFDTVVAIGDLTLLDRPDLLRHALATPGQLYLAARMGPRACRQARRELQELGLVNVRSYLLVPHHRTPHFFLTGNDPAASQQFFRHCWPLIENKDLGARPILLALRGALRPLVRALARSRRGRWLAAVVPHRAIIAQYDRLPQSEERPEARDGHADCLGDHGRLQHRALHRPGDPQRAVPECARLGAAHRR